jgi:hypothetical protein
VFLRDSQTCRRCGKGKKDACLHWAHIISRSKKSIRWNPLNSMVLCYYCHFHWAHENPLAFTRWVKGEIGEEAADMLERLGNTPRPMNPVVHEAILKDLNDKLVTLGGRTE